MDTENLTESYIELAKKLLVKATSFDEILRSLTQVNSDLKNRCEKSIHALAILKGSKNTTCSVCCSREGNTVFHPCGHGLFCENCAGRGERRGRCFTCRGTVIQSLRVFI